MDVTAEPGKKRKAEEIARSVVDLITANGEMSMRELASAMGHKSPSSKLREVVSILIAVNCLEYTNPGSPTAPNQRIRLK